MNADTVRHAVVAGVVAGMAVGALAQSPAEAAPAGPLDSLAVPTWKVRADLAVWYAAPGGNLTLPSSGGGQEVKLEVMDMDNPRLSPLAEIDMRFGKWRVSLGGFSFQADTSGSAATQAGQIGDTAFAQGDLLKSHLDFQSFEATGGYRVWDTALNAQQGVYAFVLGLDVIAGGRIYDTSVSVSQAAGPTSPSTNEFFAEPIVGLKADFDFYKVFSIDVRTTGGYFPGDHSTWSWDIALTGVYRPIENVGFLIGYRQLLFDLETGDGNSQFKFRAGMAGLFTGIELRF